MSPQTDADWDAYLEEEPALHADALELGWEDWHAIREALDEPEPIDERHVADRVLARLENAANGDETPGLALEYLPLGPDRLRRIAADVAARAPRYRTYGSKAE